MAEAGSTLKARIAGDMKAAMRAGERERLGAIRLILAAVKQAEVDSRSEQDDAQIVAILDKMAKQRREAMEQYEKAGREDLLAKERLELEVIQSYLPAPLSEAEIEALIEAAIAETGAQGIKDMGKVMGRIKPQAQGRADMGALSEKVKSRLAS